MMMAHAPATFRLCFSTVFSAFASSGPERSSSMRCASASLRRMSAARRCQPDEDFALVFRCRMSLNRSGMLHSVYEFDRAVMLNTQREEISRIVGFGRGQTPNGQQKLVLLGFNPVVFCCSSLNHEELPYLPAKLSECQILIGRHVDMCHRNIVSRHII